MLSHNRVYPTVLRSAVASMRPIRRVTTLLVVTTILSALIGCSESTRPSTTPTATATATMLPPRQQMLASHPAKPLPASTPRRGGWHRTPRTWPTTLSPTSRRCATRRRRRLY